MCIYPKISALIILSLLSGNQVFAQEQATEQNASTRLRITNERSEPICIQQDHLHQTQDPVLVKIKPGEHHDYQIPAAGLAATRFWAKTGCKDDCLDCTVGESSAIPNLSRTPSTGEYQAAIDSKLEATWGCLDGVNEADCAKNTSPNALTGKYEPLSRFTFWNSSTVDGYTLPFKIIIKNAGGSCVSAIDPQQAPIKEEIIDCSEINPSTTCPQEKVDLSLSYLADEKEHQRLQAQLSPEQERIKSALLSHSDLSYRDANDNIIGCLSPCAKLTSAQSKGLRNSFPALGEIKPDNPAAKWFCCQGKFIDSDGQEKNITPEACSKFWERNQIPYRTKLRATKCKTYTFAYDDGFGLVKCPAKATYELIFTNPKNAATTEPTSPGNPPAPSTEPTTPTNPPAPSTEPTTPSNPPAPSTEPTTPTNPPAPSTEPTTPTNPPAPSTEPTTPSNPPATSTEPTMPSTGVVACNPAASPKQRCPDGTFCPSDGRCLLSNKKYTQCNADQICPGNKACCADSGVCPDQDGLCPKANAPTEQSQKHVYTLGMPSSLTDNKLIINGQAVDWRGGVRSVTIVGDSFTARGPNGSNCTITIGENGSVKSTDNDPNNRKGNCPGIVSPDGKTLYFPANF